MGEYTILLTGANAGLGFATCSRIIDEFLSTRPATQSLRLIITTRDKRKNEDTIARLRAHLRKTITAVYGDGAKVSAIRTMQESRIRVEGETMDLCSLKSVKDCAERLVRGGKQLDCLIFNAGIGGWKGIDWPRAIWHIVSNPLEGVTFPNFKIGYTGRLVKGQEGKKKLPDLGETFAANVFGHYMFGHWLAPVLKGERRSRLIWTSSIEAVYKSFLIEDLQGLGVDTSYESSKRLIDLLVLTSDLPAAKPYVSALFSEEGQKVAKGGVEEQGRPEMYVCHPAVCMTSIMDLWVVLTYPLWLVFYLVRLSGSPWHPIDPYKGAVSATWLALATQETLDGLERAEGKAKWGAATDRFGGERVVRTEVEGYGWGGRKGETSDKNWRLRPRWWGKEVKHDDTTEFIATGTKAWKAMEELRTQWEEAI